MTRLEVPRGYERWKRQYLKQQAREQEQRNEDAKEKLRGYLV